MPNIQIHKSPLYNSSFLCQGIQEFGKLPQSTKDSASLNGFVKQLRKVILK